ncbi:zinc-binding dehydrogenase [Pelagerythrobacter sp.]|uniref:zinc-dependent alcohol dehydrogenase n=1 Tax=Pelagerythrobacter sp. TaxID=2800702 RepID=UPI0035AEF7BC
MKAARLHGPADLRIDDVPRPVPGPGQALVRVVAYSPYGTDIGTFLNRGGRYVQQYPVGIGADFSGIVEELGPDVTGPAPGTRVSALSLDHCGECARCLGGRTNQCIDPAFAVQVRQTACEEYTLVSANKLCRLPDGVSFEEAAMLAGPVDALNGFRLMGLAAGGAVTVIGVGAMGLGAIATAKALGLQVTAVGGSGKRADIAREIGADRVYPIPVHGYDVAAEVIEAQGPSDAIFESTASPWGNEQAFRLAAMGGAIAITGGSDLGIGGWTLVERELRLFGVRAGAGQAEVLAMIADGRLDVMSALSRRFAFDRAADAFALLSGEKAADIGRVIIRIAD